MELLLKNGDYVPDGRGGFVRAEGGEELIQRVLFKLTARRGGFPMMPRLGSRLFELPRYKESQRESLARQFVSEALEEEGDLNVENVTVTVKGESLVVEVFLNDRGQVLRAAVEV